MHEKYFLINNQSLALTRLDLFLHFLNTWYLNIYIFLTIELLIETIISRYSLFIFLHNFFRVFVYERLLK
jgi:hypothetical protein